MRALSQKKFSISIEQKRFLEDCEKWGFHDQSSLVREALNQFIKELEIKERKNLMRRKAHELLSDYNKNNDLTAFTALDGEDFL